MATGHFVIPADERPSELASMSFWKTTVFLSPIWRSKAECLRLLNFAKPSINLVMCSKRLATGMSLHQTTSPLFGSGRKSRSEDEPVDCWFRRGRPIVLNLIQAVTNRCGSIFVCSEAGYPTILHVPDEVFPAAPSTRDARDFFTVVTQRLPAMIERLVQASTQDTLFILSQICQALRSAEQGHQYDLFRAAQQGLPAYDRLLTHDDARVRYLAFDLVARCREQFFEQAQFLRQSIENESDPATKARMIEALEPLFVPPWIGHKPSSWARSVLDLLLQVTNDAAEPPVRLAATNLLARAQPGLLTDSMRAVFIDALVQPERYEYRPHLIYWVVEQALKSIEQLLLSHRIAILLAALPNISVAEDAHEVRAPCWIMSFSGRFNTP